MSLQTFFDNLWTDIQNFTVQTWNNIKQGGGLITTPQKLVTDTASFLGNTVNSAVQPVLLPILLIVFVFAFGGGKLA